MLSLRIAAIGKERGTPFADLTDNYLKRAGDLSASLGMRGPDLLVADAPKGLSGAKRQAKESSLLAEAALGGGEAVILDERGKDLTSANMARWLAERRDAGVPSLTFLIGGADGHDASLKPLLSPRPVRTIAFGAATWPHQLVRVMVAEQLYRAMTILAGHPYHRA